MQCLDVVRQNLFAHFCAQVDTVCSHCFVVILDGLKCSHDFSRNLGLTQAGHAKETLVVLNGHNTRDNWYLDADLTTVIHKLQVDIGVIEQLGDNNFATRVNLKTQKKK